MVLTHMLGGLTEAVARVCSTEAPPALASDLHDVAIGSTRDLRARTEAEDCREGAYEVRPELA